VRGASGTTVDPAVIGIFLRRIASSVPILLIVSLMTFSLMHFIPGDPAAAIAGLSATPQQILQLRHDLGSTSRSSCNWPTGTAACCTAISAARC